jgi:predicted Zn-dependent protease
MVSKSVTLASALTIAVLVLGGCDNAQQREAKYKARGAGYILDRKFDLARVEFKNAAKINPTDPDVYYHLGLIDEAQGDVTNAIANFSRAEVQDRTFVPALLKIARYHLAAEQIEASERKVDTILSVQPDNADAHALRAAQKMRRNNPVESEREARFALARDPANVGAISVLTALQLARGEAASAAATLDAGIARNPDEIALLLMKIDMARKANDLQKVDAAFHSLFRVLPAERVYRADLADIYLKAGRIDAAEAVWREGIAAAPESWGMKQDLIAFLDRNRGIEAAEAEITRYIAASPDQSELYFWLADLYIAHDAPDRAVHLLEKVATTEKFEPQGLNARASLARIQFAQGNRAVTEKLIAMILEKNPTHPDALFMRAGLNFDQGRYQNAVSDLTEVLRDRPRSPEAKQLLAESLLRLGSLDRAAEAQAQLVDIVPQDNAAQVRLAQILSAKGETARARATLDRVTRTNPDYPVGWESLARTAITAQDWKTAEMAIARLESLAGQTLPAAFLRGEVEAATGKPESAIAHFAQVATADPATPLGERALIALVRAYAGLDRLAAAATYLDSLNSNSSFVANLRGETELALGKPQVAEAEFEEAVAAGGGRPEPYLNLAQLRLNDHRGEQAIQVLRQGAAALPGNDRIALVLADSLSQLGRPGEAIAVYTQVLERNPSLDTAANNLAALIADFQYADPEALRLALRVAERFQGASDPAWIDTLGWVHYRLGNVPEAVSLLRRAVAVGPVSPQMRYHYGAALIRANMKEQAKLELRAATGPGQSFPGIEEARQLLASL